MNESAAYALEGRTLKNGWFVKKMLKQSPQSTGGFFSVCYIVEKDGNSAFLKALNIFAFIQMNQGRRFVDVVNELTQAFIFERDLLNICRDKKLSKVSLILDEGEEYISDCSMPTVPYLIFELADGDIRNKLSFSNDLDVAFKLDSLHQVAIGIKQLHSVSISHQDLKPSNILIYKNLISKIGDLGRSICEQIEAPHDEGYSFVGDFHYAPPEYLYSYCEPNWEKRAYGIDAYLLGSMISFYFCGVNMTALISNNLDKQFHWATWADSFEDVKPYLIDAFEKALEQFLNDINDEELRSELKLIVKDLCYPIPDVRGSIYCKKSGTKNLFLLERYISALDRLAKKAKWKLSFN